MNFHYVCRRCRAGDSPFRNFYRSFASTAVLEKNTFRERREQRAQASESYLLKLTSDELNFYRDTPPPTRAQLAFANQFFAHTDHSPVHLWASSLFRTIPPSDIPEVVFMGRSNVGKSSLINTLVGTHIAHVSGRPGRTKEFHAYGIGGKKGGDSKLSLIDIPGYGKGSQREWGEEIMKYLVGRKQLRRVFLLINPKHGLKSNDKEILEILRQNAVSHQLIFAKVDEVLVKGNMRQYRGFNPARLKDLARIYDRVWKTISTEVPPGPGTLEDILCCCAKIPRSSVNCLGLDALRWEILRAAGFDSQAPSSSEKG
ncbi:hypothetical protein VTO42DRAFT_7461 [Malbranchea cinnamomea]